MTVGPNDTESIGQVENRVLDEWPISSHGNEMAWTSPTPGKPGTETSRTLLADRDRQPENRRNWRSVIGESGSPFYLSMAGMHAWMAAAPLKLRAAVETEDAVLLLEHVGELGVAIAEHARIIQQHVAQPRESRVDSSSVRGRSP